LVASAKFLIPAAFFVFFAQQAGLHSLPFFRNPSAAEQNVLALSDVTQPASTLASTYEVIVVATAAEAKNETTPNDHRAVYLALTALWLAGCLTLFSVWGIRRRTFLRSLKLGSRVRSGREWQILVRARETLHLKQDVGLVLSPLKIEPAVWRVWRPLVVMPDSIGNQLDDQELEAIMLHELVHIQKRDNLIGNLQFVLCALLWFHPLVWFISRRIFDEREQACDESVMEVCKAPEAYASSILKVVRFCFGWRVEGVAGAASGSNLRRRIENIMTIGNTKRRAGAASRLMAGALVATALVVLVCAGVYSEARGIDAKPTEVRAQGLEATAVNVAEIISSGAAGAASSEPQKRKLPPPPPEPVQPPQPDQVPQPAQAPQPSQVPQPGQPPQPAQAPQPDQGPQPDHYPPPPEPAQAPRPGHAPHPSQAPPPPPPAAFGAGMGNGPAAGMGRGVAAGVGRATGVGSGRGIRAAGGRGIGAGVGTTPTAAPSIIAMPPTPASAPTAPAPPANQD
jgi:beta-lactamase regulating signal transducer with metallopeptidase domain